MEEIEDGNASKASHIIRRTPSNASKRSRNEGSDSGLDDDPSAPDVLQEKLAAVMAHQLKNFENQLSMHVASMREQDISARMADQRTSQDKMKKLEITQGQQSNALAMVAERVEASMEIMSGDLEESKHHIRNCADQITVGHSRIDSLEKEGWRPDPWKSSVRTRDWSDGADAEPARPKREHSAEVKTECFPPPERANWGKMPNLRPGEMSFPSSGSTDIAPESSNSDPWGPRMNPGTSNLPNPAHVLPTVSTAMTMSASNLHKICDRPKFEGSNLGRWKREMHFWRSMYSMIPDDQFIAASGLQGSPELREIVMDYTEENRASAVESTFASLLLRIDREYGALTEVQRMDRLQSLMNFKRDASWDIRQFWRNFRRLKNHAGESGVIAHEGILFPQLLFSLSLTVAHRHMVLAHFESTATLKTVENLQNITIRLFSAYVGPGHAAFLMNGGFGDGCIQEEDEDPILIAVMQKGKTASRF